MALAWGQGLCDTVTYDEAYRLLARAGIARVADLDLLMFFARHPRALLSSESLASFLGYDLKDIADSLEALMAAGLLTRVQTPAHAARLYVFAADEATGEWLPSVVALSSTREGRLALRQGLRERRNAATERTPRAKADAMTKPGPRRIVGSPQRRSGSE